MPPRGRRPDDEVIAEVGDDVTLSGQFTNDLKQATDPVNVMVRVYGAGQVWLWQYGIDAIVTHLGTGAFAAVWKAPNVPPEGARFYWRLWGEGAGVVERAHVGTIVVQGDPTYGPILLRRSASPVTIALS